MYMFSAGHISYLEQRLFAENSVLVLAAETDLSTWSKCQKTRQAKQQTLPVF